jgi:hypothetical protein
MKERHPEPASFAQREPVPSEISAPKARILIQTDPLQILKMIYEATEYKTNPVEQSPFWSDLATGINQSNYTQVTWSLHDGSC